MDPSLDLPSKPYIIIDPLETDGLYNNYHLNVEGGKWNFQMEENEFVLSTPYEDAEYIGEGEGMDSVSGYLLLLSQDDHERWKMSPVADKILRLASFSYLDPHHLFTTGRGPCHCVGEEMYIPTEDGDIGKCVSLTLKYEDLDEPPIESLPFRILSTYFLLTENAQMKNSDGSETQISKVVKSFFLLMETLMDSLQGVIPHMERKIDNPYTTTSRMGFTPSLSPLTLESFPDINENDES